MLPVRATFALSVLVVVMAAGAVSCRKSGDPAAAGSDAASDASSTDDGGAALAADGSATVGAALVAPPPIPKLPLPTPFTGNYRCFKNGLHLEQTGTIVMSTIHKDATTDTIIACTAIGDTCTGTVRDIHLVKTKSKKVDDVRPITLLRTRGGDLMVRLGHEQKSTGTRSAPSSSKAGAEDETFCPRR